MKFGPCSLKQQMVLQDKTTDIILTGGGAGSGKTTICLIKNLDAIEDPNFVCAILRETDPQLKRPGGIIHESHHVYSHFGGDYKQQAKEWVFPSGAKIIFAAVPDNKATTLQEWQGAQMCRILIDESAEWDQDRILFLLGRVRSARYTKKKQLIMTCNPNKDSFLYEWVKWCLDENGVPKPGTENQIKWFVNLSGTMHWADSKEELEQYRGNLEDKDFQPKSFRFIPMTIEDNPIILKKDPSYRANLLAQTRVNQLRFLHGSWTARVEGAGIFKREWCEIVDYPPDDVTAAVRSWDLASSIPNETNKDPDYTAGVKLSRDKYGTYYVEDVVRDRRLPDGVMRLMIETAEMDGKSEVQVTIPKDTGAGGKAANSYQIRTLAENGIPAKSVQMSGHSGKRQRFLPFAALAEGGSVKVVRGDWNEAYFTELEAFTGLTRKGHDDMVDATSDAFNTIAKTVTIPTFVIPNFSKPSIILQMR